MAIRPLALAVAVLGALALGAAPVAADADPVVQYKGTSSAVSESSNETFPASVTVDCTTLPCLANATIYDTASTEVFTVDDGAGIPLEGGSATVSFGARGAACDDDNPLIGPGTATFTVTATSAHVVADVTGSPVIDCADGSSVQYGSAHLVIDATWVSGDACLIDGSCVTAAPTPTVTPVAVAAPPAPPGASAATPSTLSALPTVTQVATPANAAWAAALTVVLVILIALPTRLINVAIETGSDRVTTWLRSRRPDAAAPRTRSPRTSWLLAGAGVLAAAAISSFVDPRFGLDPSSPRVFLSVLTSFLLDVVLGWFVVILIARRTTPGARPSVRFVPVTLVIVAAAVVFSRLTGFEPGVVFGLVAGVVFGATLVTADRARVELVALGVAFGAAVVGWVGYSALPDAPVFLRETFSAMAIGGLAALPIALVPLRGLPGEAVFAWNRWIWGAAYALGLFGFFFVLMPLPISWDAVGLSIWAWVGIYALYAVLAVGGWLLVTRPWKRLPAE